MLDELLKKITFVNSPLVQCALDFAIDAHNGEKRIQPPNEEYVCHPISVTQYIFDKSEYGKDEKTLITSLLHDVVENTDNGESVFVNWFKPISSTIGKIIFHDVKQLSVPSDLRKSQKNEWQLQQMPKLSRNLQHIKLADRAHNVVTLPTDWKNQRKLDYILHSQDLLNCISSQERVSRLGMDVATTFNQEMVKYTSPVSRTTSLSF